MNGLMYIHYWNNIIAHPHVKEYMGKCIIFMQIINIMTKNGRGVGVGQRISIKWVNGKKNNETNRRMGNVCQVPAVCIK